MLDQRIVHYLSVKTVEGLYEKILERYEEDYDRERPGLVRDAMSFIWASRRGLSETELLNLLGSNSQPLPIAYWSPLYLAVEESFVSKSGLLNFFHDFLRKAVEHRYLYNSNLKLEAHIRLADYFDKKELDERKVDELPWQLQQAGSWKRLKDCLIDPDIFIKLWSEEKQYELMGYWLSIGDRFDMVEAYKDSIKNYEKQTTNDERIAFYNNEVGDFLILNARYKGAEPLLRRALAIREKVLGPEHPDTAITLGNLSTLYYRKGDYKGAEPLYRRALAIREKVLGPEHPMTARSLDGLAVLLHQIGDYKGAEPLYRRALAIEKKVLGLEHPATAITLDHLAKLLESKGDYEGAEPLCRRALAIREKVLGPEHPMTTRSLNNLAALLFHKGDYEATEPLYRKALAIWEKVLGPEDQETATSLDNLALLLVYKGDYEAAEPLSRRSLAIWEKVLGPEHPDTAISLNNLATLLFHKGDYEAAEPLYRRALTIWENTLGKNHPYTITCRESLKTLESILYGDY